MLAISVVVTLLGLAHLYLWRRLVRDTTTRPAARKAGAVAAITLALLVPATAVGVPTEVAPWLAWPGYLWIGLLFYLLVFLIVLELPRLALMRWLGRPVAAPAPAPDPVEEQQPPTGPSRRLVISRGIALAAGLGAAGTVGYGARTALSAPVIDRQQIMLPRLPRSMDGTRLVVVSDIHIGPISGRAHVQRIVDQINTLDADVVAIVGDLVDGSVERRGAGATPLAGIRAKQGTFFVTGNHEYYSGHEEWLDRVEELGIRTLRNERQELLIRGGALDLAGVNDLAGSDFEDAPDFEKALGDRDPDRPVVLMAHQPVMATSAARYGVDLQVSGHTHGGQMAPFGLIAGLEQPVVSGLGDVDGVPVYVTNGAGFWGPPVRVGAPPQVTLLELRSP